MSLTAKIAVISDCEVMALALSMFLNGQGFSTSVIDIDEIIQSSDIDTEIGIIILDVGYESIHSTSQCRDILGKYDGVPIIYLACEFIVKESDSNLNEEQHFRIKKPIQPMKLVSIIKFLMNFRR